MDQRSFNRRFFLGSDTRSLWTRIRTSYVTPFVIAGTITYACASTTSHHERPLSSEELEAGKIAYPLDNTVPKVPYRWQRKAKGNPPRCGKKEVNLFGACYLRAHPEDFKPPCEAPTVEFEGACYLPLGEPERQPITDQ